MTAVAPAKPPSALAAAFDQSHSKLFDLASQAPSSRALVQYRKEPVRFAVEVLGIPQYRLVWSLNRGYLEKLQERVYAIDPKTGETFTGWDGTPDPIAAMLQGLADEMNVCVEAGTGTQKTFTAAIAVLWFLACWEGAIVKTFAPGEALLRAYLWKEIRELWPRFKAKFPEAVLLDLEIRMRGGQDNSWGAIGVTVKKRAGEETSIGAHGAHAPHMLLIYEEGPGVDASVYAAGENTCTAPHNLQMAIGNPDHQLDPLHVFGYDNEDKPRPNMRCVRISSLDHPNFVLNDADIVPGAASVKSVESRREKYVTTSMVDGKLVRVEGRLYLSRVRGKSPSQAAEALIQLEWIREAQRKYRDDTDRGILLLVGKGRESRGVDAANSKDGDHAAISRWKGAVCYEVPSFPCPNANAMGFRMHLEMDEKGISPENVGIDTVGVGSGTYNELLNWNKICRAISGGPEGGYESEEFLTRRSEVYWMLREDFRLGRIAVCDNDEALVRELITPTWKTQNSKIIVEPKEDIQKRTPDGRSPNKADALAYGNAVRPRDIVVEKPPKRAPTIREQVMAELQAMDKVKPKKFYHVLRQ